MLASSKVTAKLFGSGLCVNLWPWRPADPSPSAFYFCFYPYAQPPHICIGHNLWKSLALIICFTASSRVRQFFKHRSPFNCGRPRPRGVFFIVEDRIRPCGLNQVSAINQISDAFNWMGNCTKRRPARPRVVQNNPRPSSQDFFWGSTAFN
jgi:hypothetical protein